MNKDVKIGLALAFVLLGTVTYFIFFSPVKSAKKSTPDPKNTETKMAGLGMGGQAKESSPPPTWQKPHTKTDPQGVVDVSAKPGFPDLASAEGKKAPDELDKSTQDVLDGIDEFDKKEKKDEGGGDGGFPVDKGDGGTGTEVDYSDLFGDDPPESEKPKEPQSHKVASGETLMDISRLYYGTTKKWRKIMEANSKKIPDARSMRAGITLTIPVLEKETSTKTTQKTTTTTETEADETGTTYIVQKGDSFWSIAQKKMGDGSKSTALYKFNKDRLELSDPRDLRIKMTIKFPTD